MIMLESERITENIARARAKGLAKIIAALGLQKLMFEASDPAILSWYMNNYGPEADLFVDHGQMVQLEAPRAGI